MDATAASRREERAGATTQLWKTNDALANKDGPRSTVFWVNKNTYTGEWRGNQKEGRGEYTYTDKGLKYEGDFLRGKRHGHGVLWQKEKGGRMRRVYEGEWCQGKRQGSGTLYSSNGDVFTGSWNANKRHGKGKLAYEGGDYYDGDFVGGLREGYGVLTKSNGDRFEGNWALDKKEGPGVYYYMAKMQMYEGEWRDDVAKCGKIVDIGPDEYDSRIPEVELEEPNMVVSSRINTLRIERAASGVSSSPPEFGKEQLSSLARGFEMVDVEGLGHIPAFRLADVFAKFGAELGADECRALLGAIGCVDETASLRFEDFVNCMAVLVRA